MHARRVRLPAWWLHDALCVHRHESGDWHYGPGRTGGRPWNGYYGGMQFLLGTWRHAAALLRRRDDPQWAAPRVQLTYAYAIWSDDGGSWREWPNTSRLCGLR